MHINHRRKNKHTCYKFADYGYRKWSRRKPKWDRVKITFNSWSFRYVYPAGYPTKKTVACAARVFPLPNRIVRKHDRLLVASESFDDIVTKFKKRWDWCD